MAETASYTPLPASSVAAASAIKTAFRMRAVGLISLAFAAILIIGISSIFKGTGDNLSPENGRMPIRPELDGETRALHTNLLGPVSRGPVIGVSEKTSGAGAALRTGGCGSYPWTNDMLQWQRTGFHFQPLRNWMNDPNVTMYPHQSPKYNLEKLKNRFKEGDAGSTSVFFEGLCSEGKAFLCYAHVWRKDQDELLISLHNLSMENFKHPTGNFLNIDGWRHVQEMFAEKNTHFISLHFLQKRFHQINPSKTFTEYEAHCNDYPVNLCKMYRKWNRVEDFQILYFYDNMMRDRAAKQQRIAGVQYADLLNIQKMLVDYLYCIPPIPHIKGRLEYLLANRSGDMASTSQAK